MVLPLKKIDSFLTGKLQMLQVTSGAACNKTFTACSTLHQSFIIKKIAAMYCIWNGKTVKFTLLLFLQ